VTQSRTLPPAEKVCPSVGVTCTGTPTSCLSSCKRKPPTNCTRMSIPSSISIPSNPSFCHETSRGRADDIGTAQHRRRRCRRPCCSALSFVCTVHSLTECNTVHQLYFQPAFLLPVAMRIPTIAVHQLYFQPAFLLPVAMRIPTIATDVLT